MVEALVVVVALAVIVTTSLLVRPRRTARTIGPLSPADAAELAEAFARVEAEHRARAEAAAAEQVRRLVRAAVTLASVQLTDPSGSFALARLRFRDGTDLVLHRPGTLPLVQIAAAVRDGSTVRLRDLERGPHPTLVLAVNGRAVRVPTAAVLHVRTDDGGPGSPTG